MTNIFCEYAPGTPSPYNVGAMSAAILLGLGLSFSGQGVSSTSQLASVHISGSGAGHRLVYSGENLHMVSEQNIKDLQSFSSFSLGISNTSSEVPEYFFDVLNEDFESFLA